MEHCSNNKTSFPRLICLLIIVISALSILPGLSQDHQWERIGPDGEEVRDIALDSDGNLYAAGTYLYRSSDNGENWEKIEFGNNVPISIIELSFEYLCIHTIRLLPGYNYRSAGRNCHIWRISRFRCVWTYVVSQPGWFLPNTFKIFSLVDAYRSRVRLIPGHDRFLIVDIQGKIS